LGGFLRKSCRFAVPDLPHHVTQRGNCRQRMIFGDDHDALNRDPLAEACRREGVRNDPRELLIPS
jgi:putative transposase